MARGSALLAQGSIGPPNVMLLIGNACMNGIWAMLLLGFAGIGFVTYRRKSKPALMAA
jgi:hypothetical protein